MSTDATDTLIAWLLTASVLLALLWWSL